MNPTKLLYLEDMSISERDATVQEVREQDGVVSIILDQTIFYPQGGGQPYDTGRIDSASVRFIVSQVRFADGIVSHIGMFEHGTLAVGDSVVCKVDAARRSLHSRLHSAGHIVDMAVTRMGLPWTPGKGYHFPDGPYVEYVGLLDGVDKDKLKADLEKLCNEIIVEDAPTSLRFMEKEKMHEVCHFVPDVLPEGKPTRVILFGTFGVACGGTHIASGRQIGAITIRKISMKDGNVRVGYDVERV